MYICMMAANEKCYDNTQFEPILLFILSIACAVIVVLTVFMDNQMIKMGYFGVTILHWIFVIIYGIHRNFYSAADLGINAYRFCHTVVPTALHTLLLLGGYGFQLNVKY